VAAPKLLAFSDEVAALVGLTPETRDSEQLLAVLAGNAPWPGARPVATNYGGHQFGNWAGQLGDGRAILVAELQGPAGRFELQLKGAGPTPYSRRGDGRAVLRSSLREFLCSESMHHLGIPTTRALSLVGTGEPVVRDMFYDGHPEAEPGAIVCRVAPSFLRFGHFELPASRGDLALLSSLVAFAIETYFPELGSPGAPATRELLLEVARRTGRLIARWQSVGFVHGVMNTDNMSLLGLTIDYGPYGWLDSFDPSWTPNTTDAEMRRYRYGGQPGIGAWNVARLAVALGLLLETPAEAQEAAVEAYRAAFEDEAMRRFAAKLGLGAPGQPEDGVLVDDLFAWMVEEEIDMTIFFRSLAGEIVKDAAPAALPESLRGAFYRTPSAAHERRACEWLTRWWHRTRREGSDPDELARRMDAHNPRFVLRNWIAQEAIEAAHAGDLAPVRGLLEELRRPYDDDPQRPVTAGKRPDWARRKPGCSALSCSS
jgi:uncharacterized protein YdiU (UPF0061 family)